MKTLVKTWGMFVIITLAGLLLSGCKQPQPTAESTTTNAAAAPQTAPAPAPAAVPATQAQAVAAAATLTPSGPPVRNVSMMGCKTRIDGTATGKTWSMEGAVISGYFEVNPADLFAGKTGKLAAKAEVKIPVRSMKSGSTIMDERMQKEMRMDDFPMIGYVLEELTLKAGTAGGPVAGEARGALAIAGVTNKITLPVNFTRTGEGTMNATTAISLKMSDYKIPPPKFSILGAEIMETGDEIKVTLEWLMKARP